MPHIDALVRAYAPGDNLGNLDRVGRLCAIDRAEVLEYAASLIEAQDGRWKHRNSPARNQLRKEAQQLREEWTSELTK